MAGRFRRKTNHDHWRRLDLAAAPHRVTYEWVKGHSGDAEQEAADELAQEVAHAGSADEGRLRTYAARFGRAA